METLTRQEVSWNSAQTQDDGTRKNVLTRSFTVWPLWWYRNPLAVCACWIWYIQSSELRPLSPRFWQTSELWWPPPRFWNFTSYSPASGHHQLRPFHTNISCSSVGRCISYAASLLWHGIFFLESASDTRHRLCCHAVLPRKRCHIFHHLSTCNISVFRQ